MDRTYKSYALPLLSGIILVFAYPPFSIPLIPFVGLVPLFLFLSLPRTARETFLGALAFSVPYFVGNLYWLFNLGAFTLAGIAGAFGALLLHLGTFFLFPLALNVVQHRLRIPLPLSAPFLWLVAEHIRTYGDFNFPWVTLGYSLSRWPWAIQHADLVGVYGISWWLAAINALVAAWIVNPRVRRTRTIYAACLLAALVVPAGYNSMRWRSVNRMLADAPTVHIAAMQPNVEQKLKWDPAARQETLARINRQIRSAERTGADLVVGPEACLQVILPENAGALPRDIVRGSRPLLLGLVRGVGPKIPVHVDGRRGYRFESHYNSAVLAGPDRSILGSHDKLVLVPVSEQIPYRKVFSIFLPFMRRQFGRFIPGEELGLLQLPGRERPMPFGALVCYESVFPDLVRQMTAAGAHFLVNITNDAWFGRTSMPFQHLRFSVVRAIENRRSVVCSANTGITAVIDPLGRITERTELFREAVLEADVPLLQEGSVYVLLGDALLYLSYLWTLVLLALAWRNSRVPPGIPAGANEAETA